MGTRNYKAENKTFIKELLGIAIPVMLQCMLQSSFSIIDELMIGQLGSQSIAAIGLAGKFASMFSFVVGSVGAVAGIMVSQYIGAEDKAEAKRSYNLNLLIAILVAGIFCGSCLLFSRGIIGLYTEDSQTIELAAEYLRIVCLGFIPMAVNICNSVMFRCNNKAKLPLYVSFAGAVMNTALNYVLIFGRFGFSKMGVKGAAVASLISTLTCMLVQIALLKRLEHTIGVDSNYSIRLTKMKGKEYICILFPILINEFLWSLGENIYASIYGHLGTESCAAMTLTNPIQGLVIGGLSGLAAAAGIIVGKGLGAGDFDKAYKDGKKLMLYGFAGALLLSCLLVALKGVYIDIFKVEEEVKVLGQSLLVVFAIVSPFKVLNMILGGGVIRAGGKTKIIMIVDLIGTWGIGVPVGLLTAYVFKLPVTWVYFLLSLEECVRFLISLYIFRKRSWMQQI